MALAQTCATTAAVLLLLLQAPTSCGLPHGPSVPGHTLPPGLPDVPLPTEWQGVGCSILPLMGSEGQKEIGGVCPQEGGKDDTEEGAGSVGVDGDGWRRR